jgi:hypothetical protein
MQGSFFALSVAGIGSLDNVSGDVIAETLGINMSNLTRDVIVVIAWVGGLFVLLLVTPVLRCLPSKVASTVSSCMPAAAGPRKSRTAGRGSCFKPPLDTKGIDVRADADPIRDAGL